MMVLGLLWLVAALGFIAAGVAITFGSPLAFQLTGLAAGISLIPTIVWWNDAWIGAVVSAVLLALTIRERLDPERRRK